MPLVVETGTNTASPVPNSYVSVDDLIVYAEDRGLTITDDEDALSGFALRAMDYLEAYRDRFGGTKTDAAQPLQFPRTNLYIDGNLIDPDFIPIELRRAQCQLVVELNNGVDLFPTQTGQAKKRSTVGPITDEFFAPDITPNLPAVDALLAPLLRSRGALRTVRV